MWSSFIGRMPSGLVMICAILSFIIPMGIYWINQELHKYGDPPWKQQPSSDQEKDPQ